VWINAKRYTGEGTNELGGHGAAPRESAQPQNLSVDTPLEICAAQHRENK